MSTLPVETTEVCWVTGKDSLNSTGSRAAVHATDLGILWDAGDNGVLVAFGDSYGAGWCGHGAGPRHADWRCNVLARTPLTEPSEGMVLDSWVEDAPGHAAQVLPRDPDAREETVIPTAGIAVGGRQYLHAMSVRRWHGPGRWTTNYSALWSSTDGGRRWERTGVQWRNGPRRWWQRWRPDGSPFQMGALAATGSMCCSSALPTAGSGRRTWPGRPRLTCTRGSTSMAAPGYPTQEPRSPSCPLRWRSSRCCSTGPRRSGWR